MKTRLPGLRILTRSRNPQALEFPRLPASAGHSSNPDGTSWAPATLGMHESLPLPASQAARLPARPASIPGPRPQWISFADGGDDCFDPEEYAYFDSPLNADEAVLRRGRPVSPCPRALFF